MPKTKSKKRDNKPKLDDEHIAFCINALAQFTTQIGVIGLLGERFGISYSPASMCDFNKTHIETIEAVRETYLKDIGSIGIAHRKVRLRHYERLMGESENDKLLQVQCLKGAQAEMAPIQFDMPGEGDTGDAEEVEAFLAETLGQ